MKVVTLGSGGGLDQLQVVKRDAPGEPGPGEIRVRIHASSLNFHDYAVVAGMIPTEDGRIPMSDGAGVVEAVGEGVEEFVVGDAVVSTFFPYWLDGPARVADFKTTPGDGIDGYAREQVIRPATWFTHAPKGYRHEEAATLTTAGLKVAELARGHDEPLSQLAHFYEPFPQVLITVPIARRGSLELADGVWDAIAGAEAELGDDGRVLVRESGTEVAVRVMVEAADKRAAQRAARSIAGEVEARLEGLRHLRLQVHVAGAFIGNAEDLGAAAALDGIVVERALGDGDHRHPCRRRHRSPDGWQPRHSDTSARRGGGGHT